MKFTVLGSTGFIGRTVTVLLRAKAMTWRHRTETYNL